MKLFLFILIGFMVMPIQSFGRSSNGCLPPLDILSFHRLLDDTRRTYFPELDHESIIVSTFSSDAYFFQAQPVVNTLMGNRSKRQYSVQLNLKLLSCPPSHEALTAILIHELEHIKDYTSWSTSKILDHALKYSLSNSYRTHYERSTDLKTLEKGVHAGLADYRVWLYQWLTPKELKKKKRFYLTPEEILDQ